MTRLSVNINKVATLRNARGGNMPDVVQFARDCECFGAQGITVHPRPDERHIRYSDVVALKPVVGTEFNIEGNPRGRASHPPYGFIDLVKSIVPTQVTLVPDAEGALTSNAGWDTVSHAGYLREVVAEFKKCGIRVSVFVDAEARMVEGAARVGADRVELYTERYASAYHAACLAADETAKAMAIRPFVEAAKVAQQNGLGLNAGHDLSLENLSYFHQQIAWVDEVSIGHALISDALYLGIEETIRRYRACLQ
ncbi:MAG: pyridoxine 5'-phosphate synthase [Bacteroidales bacterium]|nr:pyridoxine 5'-phosphate synthase [Bacteroidales bacterium]